MNKVIFIFCLSPLILFLSACSSVNPFNYQEQAEKWDKDRLAAYNSLQKNDLALSKKLYGQALLQAEKFGKDDARVATSVQELADIYIQEKDYKKAIPLYERSADIYQKLWKASSSNNERIAGRGQDLACVLVKLGECYEKENQITKAEKCYRRSIRTASIDVIPVKLFRQLINNYKNFLSRQNRTAEASQISDTLEGSAPIQTYKNLQQFED